MVRHRFYNQYLRGTYAACPLPAIRPPDDVAPIPRHIVPEHEYRRTEVRRSLHCPWRHTRFLPPRLWTRPDGIPPLSRPFNGFDPMKPTPAQGARKRPKVNKAGSTKAKAGAKKRPKVNKAGSTKTKAGSTKDATDNDPKTNGQKRKQKLQADGVVFRSAKVRMWPTAAQRKELMRCFDVCRYAYNWANECVQVDFCRPNERLLRDRFRALKLMQKLPYANTPETEIGSGMVAHAVKQLTDAYSSNFAKHKKDPSHRFHIDFRARSPKKTPTEVIVIEKARLAKTSLLHRFEPCECLDRRSGRAACKAFFGKNLEKVGGVRMQDSTRIINRMLAEGDFLKENGKIQWDKRTGAFYFIYLYTVQKPVDPDPDFMHKRIVATDPGCAPFQEWYSPTSGEFGALLDNGFPQIRSRCHRIDHLVGRLARRRNTPMHMMLTERRRECMTLPKMRRAHRGTTRRLKRKLAKERRRLHGYIESAHYDAANFLLDEHDIVVLPVLKVGELARRTDNANRTRLFGNKMARAMYTWSHGEFRRRLISASARCAGRHVYETTEPGTSKTCNHCGRWNASLRLGDKLFECPRCALAIDRQLAGARNNFLAAYGMACGMLWDNVTQ
jgi:transposase